MHTAIGAGWADGSIRKCIKNCVNSFDGGRAINYDSTKGEL